LLAAGTSELAQRGDLGAARQRYDAAYQLAERAGDEAAMALAALGLGGLWVHEHRTAAGSVLLRQRLTRALSTAEPSSALALRLRVRLAGEADFSTGDSEKILAALGAARATGDPVTRADALNLAHGCLLGPGHSRLRRHWPPSSSARASAPDAAATCWSVCSAAPLTCWPTGIRTRGATWKNCGRSWRVKIIAE
jgi:hypothetical protein